METTLETREMITYIKGKQYKVVAYLHEDDKLVTADEWIDCSREELLRSWNIYSSVHAILKESVEDRYLAANPKPAINTVEYEQIPHDVARSIDMLRLSFQLNLTEYMLMIAPDWMEHGVGFIEFDPPKKWIMNVWKYDKFGNLLSDEPYEISLK